MVNMPISPALLLGCVARIYPMVELTPISAFLSMSIRAQCLCSNPRGSIGSPPCLNLGPFSRIVVAR